MPSRLVFVFQGKEAVTMNPNHIPDRIRQKAEELGGIAPEDLIAEVKRGGSGTQKGHLARSVAHTPRHRLAGLVKAGNESE